MAELIALIATFVIIFSIRDESGLSLEKAKGLLVLVVVVGFFLWLFRTWF